MAICTMTWSNAGSALSAETVPDNALWRLSPSGSRVARMTSRAGIRTRTVVPVAECAIGGEQRAAIEGQLDESALGMSSSHTRLEDASQSNGLPKPWQVWTTHQIRQRPTRNGATVLENQQMRREPHDVLEIVRDENQRNVERSAQLINLILQSSPHRAIHGGKRFVEEQDRRLPGEGPRQRDALTLPAGQLVRTAVQMLGQVHEREQRFRPRASLAPRPMPERGDHVAHGRQVRKQRVLLKYEPDGTAMRWSEDSSRRLAPCLGARSHRRLSRLIESCDASQDRRLAAPRRPEDGQDITGIAREFEIERNWSRLPEAHRQTPVTHDGCLRGVRALSSSSGSPRR